MQHGLGRWGGKLAVGCYPFPHIWAAPVALVLWVFPSGSAELLAYLFASGVSGIFQKKAVCKDEDKTTGDKWLIWQWEIAPGIGRSLTLCEHAVWLLPHRRETCRLPAEARPWGERA